MVCFTTVDQSSVVLQTMFVTKKHMDVSFLAGPDKKIVQAHRSVLTAALEYFDLMLSGSFKEGESSTVILDQIEEEILESIVKFLYCGVIDIPDMETAFQLWEPCHMMKIKSIQDHIVEFMKINITSQNCLGVYFLAKKYEEEDLASLSMGFAVSNILNVIEENEFLHLGKDHLVSFIKAAKENGVDEDKIWKAALTWINFNEQPQEHLREILYLLDIEKTYDLSLIDEFESMCTEIEDIKYISNRLKKRYVSNTSLLQPRNSSPGDVIVIIQYNGKTKTISEFDVTSNVILGEENVDFDGTVLGIWKGTLILLQKESDQSKVTSYNIKIKTTNNVGVYRIGDYLDSTILDDELYIVTQDHVYIINLITGHLPTTLDCPSTFQFKGATTINGLLYLILLKSDGGELQVAQYDRESKMIEKFENSLDFRYFTYKKSVGHSDYIFIFSYDKYRVFNLIKKQFEDPYDVSVSDAVSTKNKVIVIQAKALYECEYRSSYQFSKTQCSFGFLKDNCQIFSL